MGAFGVGVCGGYIGGYIVMNLSYCDETIHVFWMAFCVL